MSKGISTASAKAKYKQAKTPFEYLMQRVLIPFEDTEGKGCWTFTGGKDKNGYGQVHASKTAKELGVTRAHQMSWLTFYPTEPIPKGYFVCHTCDNPSCINPKHLFLGTPKDNVTDMVNKGRHYNGAVKNKHYEEILACHGALSCKEVAKMYGVTFSRVCGIWRENGKRGRNH